MGDRRVSESIFSSTFLAGFRRLAINLDPEKLMYLFIYLCLHLIDAVQDVVLMQK